MVLPKNEQVTFFENYYPLLHYAAVYTGLVPKETTLKDFFNAPIDVTAKSRDAVFTEKDLLAYYASDNKRFLQTLMPGFVDGVKKGVFSEFMVLTLEKDFGVFMDRKTGLFYHVTALTDRFDTALKFIPGYCKTALFNFKNHLVWDGLVIQKPKPVNTALAQTLLQQYAAALKAKRVIELL